MSNKVNTKKFNQFINIVIMTNQEMKELDAWIAEHVEGYIYTDSPDDFTAEECRQYYRHTTKGQNEWRVIVSEPYRHNGILQKGLRFAHSWKNYSPTTNTAAAMIVLEKCAKKLAESNESIDIEFHKSTEWNVNVCAMYYGASYEARLETQAESLPLAICMFAKKLYAQNVKT